MPDERDRERAPRRQVESTPAPSTRTPEDDATPKDTGPEARMRSPWDDEGEASGAGLGHLHEQQAHDAQYENQNLFGTANPSSYNELARAAAGDDAALFYEPPKQKDGSAYRDPAFVGVTHDFFVPLAKHVFSVRPGTPVSPGAEGWEIAKDPHLAYGLARFYAEGGTRVAVSRLATLETYQRQFKSGDRVGVDHVDDRGAIVWNPTDGPFIALNDTQVLVDLTRNS